jgi:hypothetical protein
VSDFVFRKASAFELSRPIGFAIHNRQGERVSGIYSTKVRAAEIKAKYRFGAVGDTIHPVYDPRWEDLGKALWDEGPGYDPAKTTALATQRYGTDADHVVGKHGRGYSYWAGFVSPDGHLFGGNHAATFGSRVHHTDIAHNLGAALGIAPGSRGVDAMKRSGFIRLSSVQEHDGRLTLQVDASGAPPPTTAQINAIHRLGRQHHEFEAEAHTLAEMRAPGNNNLDLWSQFHRGRLLGKAARGEAYRFVLKAGTWSEVLQEQNPGSHWVTREGKRILIKRGGRAVTQKEIEAARAAAPQPLQAGEIPADWEDREVKLNTEMVRVRTGGQPVWSITSPTGYHFETLEQEIVTRRSQDPGWTVVRVEHPTELVSAEDLKRGVMETLARQLKDNPDFSKVMQRLSKEGNLNVEYSTAFYDTMRMALENTVSTLIIRWTETSGDDDALAVAIQTAIQQEFGIPDEARWYWKKSLNKAEDYKDIQPGLRAFVRAMYANTQAWFKERGIQDPVVLTRGAKWSLPGEIKQYASPPPNWVEAIPEGVSRAVAMLQPASAFTVNNGVADQFSAVLRPSDNETSLVMAAAIPVSKILSTPQTGFGSLGEREVVVLGGPVEAHVYKITKQGLQAVKAKHGNFKHWNWWMTGASGGELLQLEVGWPREQDPYGSQRAHLGVRIKLNPKIDDVMVNDSSLYGDSRKWFNAEAKEWAIDKLLAEAKRIALERAAGPRVLTTYDLMLATQAGRTAKALRRPRIYLDEDLHNADWLVEMRKRRAAAEAATTKSLRFVFKGEVAGYTARRHGKTVRVGAYFRNAPAEKPHFAAAAPAHAALGLISQDWQQRMGELKRLIAMREPGAQLYTVTGRFGDIIKEDATEEEAAAWRKKGYAVEKTIGSEKQAKELKAQVMVRLADRLEKDPAFHAEHVARVLSDHNSLATHSQASRLARSRVENSIDSLISSWHVSSGDDNELSVSLQQAIREEFGIPTTANWYWKKSLEKARREYGELWPDLRAFVHAMYDETQAWFKERGITEVPVMRGSIWAQNSAGASYLIGKLPGWAKALPDGLSRSTMQLQPASAFSVDPDIAAQFASMPIPDATGHVSDEGVVSMLTMAQVPASRILSTPATGFGALKESEVVVLGGEVDAHVFKHTPTPRWEFTPQAGVHDGWRWQTRLAYGTDLRLIVQPPGKDYFVGGGEVSAPIIADMKPENVFMGEGGFTQKEFEQFVTTHRDWVAHLMASEARRIWAVSQKRHIVPVPRARSEFMRMAAEAARSKAAA